MSTVIPFPSRARPRPALDIAADMSVRLRSMVVIQMQAYPQQWSEAERREAAEQALFGKDGAA